MISTTVRSITYSENDVTYDFAFPFKILQASDLVVTSIDPDGNETVYTQGVNYNITTPMKADTGSITLTDTPGPHTIGYKLRIERVVEVLQPARLRNQRTFYPDVLEDALDRAVMVSLDLKDIVDRSAHFSSDYSDWNTQLPTPVADYVLAFDVVNKKFKAQVGGATGATGDAGAPGSVIYTSSGVPSAGTGINGDYNINLLNYDLYKKATGTWSVIGNIKGGAANPAHRELVAYYESPMTTADKQPVFRCPVARTLQRIDYFKDNAIANTTGTTIVLYKNGVAAYTWTIAGALANQTMTNITTTPISFAAGDRISWGVTAVGATPPSNLSIIADFTEAL